MLNYKHSLLVLWLSTIVGSSIPLALLKSLNFSAGQIDGPCELVLLQSFVITDPGRQTSGNAFLSISEGLF